MAQTWRERLDELRANRQDHLPVWRAVGETLTLDWTWIREHDRRYPFLLGLYDAALAPLIAQAARETGAPIRVSEEWYADFPDHCGVYWTQPGDLEAFWRVYDRLKAAQKEHDEAGDCARWQEEE